MKALVFSNLGVELRNVSKKQRNSQFDKLVQRARNIDFELEKTGDDWGKYEIWSNDVETGTVYVCMTLKEVEIEIAGLEAKYL